MHKDITFLNEVEESNRQKVINFVKDWNSKDEWIIVTTSGSTGKPKKIKLLKSQIKASAQATINYFNLKPNQTILLTLSPDYIAGKLMLVRGLINQMNIIVAPFKSNPLISELTQKIDFSAFVPMQVSAILANPKTKKKYNEIDKVIIGGGQINNTLEQKIQLLKNKNFATFGMTETISHIAVRNINNKEQLYTALPNVQFSVQKNECLTVYAPKVCNQPIYTNDCVDLLNDKQFIWKGRVDFVINSGGLKLHPEEIEKKIRPHIPNQRFYLIGEKDELLGEKLILKIESDKNIDIDLIKLNLQQHLLKFEVPKSIQLVNQFAETKTGKIIRK